MSEIDSKLVAQARPYPNGWVYVIDGVFPDGAAVRPERIVGEWKVGPDGIITGEYKANGKYHAFKFKLFRMRLPVKPGKAMPSEMLLPRSPMARASQRGKRFAAAGHRNIVSVLGEQWGGSDGPRNSWQPMVRKGQDTASDHGILLGGSSAFAPPRRDVRKFQGHKAIERAIAWRLLSRWRYLSEKGGPLWWFPMRWGNKWGNNRVPAASKLFRINGLPG